MFRGEKINVTEKRAVLHVALRAPKGASIVVDGENVVPQVHAVLEKMAGFSEPSAQRGVEGRHRQAHSQRGEHRDRRLRPRAGDGLRSAEALQRSGHDVPFRLQRGWHGFRRSGPRSRRGGDAVHGLFEDLHHTGDDDQRPHGARLVAGRPGRRREGDRASTSWRCRRTPRRWRSSGSIRPTCSASGTGWAGAIPWNRPSGFRPCWPSGPEQLSRHARRLPPDGRAFPHGAVRAQSAGADGPAGGLVRRFLRRRRRSRCCLTSST